MRSTFCKDCGKPLIEKLIQDEGMIPFCESCNNYHFDTQNVCVLVVVINEHNEIALIKQHYVTQEYFIGVAGYIKVGETAEETVKREVKEEIGLEVNELTYLSSHFYQKKDMLMLGFLAHVNKKDFTINHEVNEAKWFTYNEALQALREGSIIKKLVMQVFEI